MVSGQVAGSPIGACLAGGATRKGLALPRYGPSCRGHQGTVLSFSYGVKLVDGYEAVFPVAPYRAATGHGVGTMVRRCDGLNGAKVSPGTGTSQTISGCISTRFPIKHGARDGQAAGVIRRRPPRLG